MNNRFNIRYFNKNIREFEYYKIGTINTNPFTDCTIYEQGEFCTGLKDKNGKLIYEGDIVKSDFDFITNTINPLRFNIGNVIYSDYIAGFVIASDINDYSPYKTSFFGKTEALNCIVIGNIYENKSLLESEG